MWNPIIYCIQCDAMLNVFIASHLIHKWYYGRRHTVTLNLNQIEIQGTNGDRETEGILKKNIYKILCKLMSLTRYCCKFSTTHVNETSRPWVTVKLSNGAKNSGCGSCGMLVPVGNKRIHIKMTWNTYTEKWNTFRKTKNGREKKSARPGYDKDYTILIYKYFMCFIRSHYKQDRRWRKRRLEWMDEAAKKITFEWRIMFHRKLRCLILQIHHQDAWIIYKSGADSISPWMRNHLT